MRDKIVYWFIPALLVVLMAVWMVRSVTTTEYLELSTQVQARPDIWYTMIASDINSSDLKLSVDGKSIESKEGKIFMSNNMTIMIPKDVISEAFDCAVNLYDKETLIIEKGTVSIELTIDADTMFVNEDTVSLDTPMVWMENVLYVPGNIFEYVLGYSYTWDAQNNMAMLINENTDLRTLPYYYSYVDKKKTPVIKDQGFFGTCWAFASLTALESTLLPEESYDFSEDHMSLSNSFAGDQNDGGESTMAIAYLAAWQGPVLEADDKYGDGLTTEGLSAVKHVQEVQIVESKDYETIKKMIYKYGGVQSSLYTSLKNSDSTSVYYNSDTYAYCYIGTEKPNHDVVIIGWDDNYSKDNFTTDLEGDGAFICRNSWGNAFGDEGNFYVSYYDTNIGIHNVVYTKVEDSDNYDNIYQADLCGWVGNLGYSDSDTAYFANVYTAKKDETIKAVSFYATAVDYEYEIYVVRNFKDKTSLQKLGESAASGVCVNSGYYTIELDNTYNVSEGEKFAVVVRAKAPNSTKPIAIEFKNDQQTQTVNLDDGEGYFSLKGIKWDSAEENECNICLKAFTINR
ncbi:MAG: lectin like domain-containing protein [Eubacterium sp.]